MKNNKSIIKIITVFVLWMSGMNICIAQCPADGTDVFVGYTVDDAGTPVANPPGSYYTVKFGGTICIVDLGGDWATWDVSAVGLTCDQAGGCLAVKISDFPFSADATLFLVFLSFLYGIFIYRRQRSRKIAGV